MKELGKMTNSMVKVHLYGQMVKNISVIMFKAVKMELVQLNGQMEVYSTAYGKMIFGMVWANILIPKVRKYLVNGTKARKLELFINLILIKQ